MLSFISIFENGISSSGDGLDSKTVQDIVSSNRQKSENTQQNKIRFNNMPSLSTMNNGKSGTSPQPQKSSAELRSSMTQKYVGTPSVGARNHNPVGCHI